MSRHFDRLVIVGFAVLALSATVHGQLISFQGVPFGGGQGNIGQTDPSCTVTGDTITCPTGGVLVHFAIFATGWDDGTGRELGGIGALLDGATLHNGLYQILPLGYDGDRTIGAYQVREMCFGGASDGLACGFAGVGPFGPGLPGVTLQECQADGGFFCSGNADFIIACCDTPPPQIAPPDYYWNAGIDTIATRGAIDDGTLQYLGDFVLEVPVGAGGQWTIGWNDDIDWTYMADFNSVSIPIQNLLPGILRIPLDCNENGIDDLEDIANGTSQDCNNNGIPDECDLDNGTSSDCNANAVPDECDPLPDCNGNGVLDVCDIAAGEPDCDANGVPDVCQVPPLGPPEGDCNTNGVPDACDIAAGDSSDCNLNAVPDSCDIANGTSLDDDEDGIPDECRNMPRLVPGDVKKNRYVSFIPTNLTDTLALRVDILDSTYFPESIGEIGWVSEPNTDGRAYVVAEPVMRVWTDQTVYLGDCHIVPATTYGVRALVGAELFAPLTVGTIDEPFIGQFWADSVGGFDGQQWTAPNGIVNFQDIAAIIRSFQQTPSAPHITRTDLHPEVPNWFINFSDIQQVVAGYRFQQYPYSSPADCP